MPGCSQEEEQQEEETAEGSSLQEENPPGGGAGAADMQLDYLQLPSEGHTGRPTSARIWSSGQERMAWIAELNQVYWRVPIEASLC